MATSDAHVVSVRPRLGQLLVQAGLIDDRQLAEALDSRQSDAHGRWERLGRTLVRLGFTTEAEVSEMLATQHGLDFVSGDALRPDVAAVQMLSGTIARRYGVLPLEFDDDGTLVVATADPTDIVGRDDVRTATGVKRIRPVIAPWSEIDATVRRTYGFEEQAGDLIGALDEAAADEADLEPVTEADAPMIRLVDGMIHSAIEAGASDIHVEPGVDGATVRYRVDGVLHEAMKIPRGARGQFVARIKLLASMDIAERRLPQDGRARFSSQNQEVDLRVSSLPSLYGETMVLRLLLKGAERLDLDELGLDDGQMARLLGALERPQGLILLTGPTGSGKTSTLYAALGHLADESRNIITLEDPIEYELPGVNQTQIIEGIGRTFARCLRTVLRQDPDIVMVGEIRDRETAELAAQASMTGHLVLSTLHTNDAPSAVVRLRDLGVPPWLITGSLTLVIAQRLVRRICTRCRTDHTPTDREIAQLHLSPRDLELLTFKTGAGCNYCNHSGYRGRIGLFEVLPIDARVRDLLLSGASTSEVHKAARQSGMRSLREEGLARAADGVTSLEELLRVAPHDAEADDGTCPVCAHVVQPEFAVCPWCGTQLGLPTCATCTRTLEHGWRVCPDCGTPIAADPAADGLPVVLVVDDDPSVRATIAAMLDGDFEVVEAEDGQRALESVHRDLPDLLLLDVRLPKIDGYEVTRALRRKQSTMDLPVLLITGDDNRDTELQGLHAGADDYITKPFDPDVLRARMDALLRRSVRS